MVPKLSFQRKEYIENNNCIKYLFETDCGVPQGSILGLSLINVNDFDLVSKLWNVRFADDAIFFISVEYIGELYQQINKELKKVFLWFKENKLSINIDKTKWTIFYSTSKKPFMLTKLYILFKQCKFKLGFYRENEIVYSLSSTKALN